MSSSRAAKGMTIQEAASRLDATRFEVVREIGKGGMATIYLAKDRDSPGRPVALKVIHPHLAGDPDLIARFKHEVRAQVGLKHECIVEMLGWGEDHAGRLFMAMEYVEGPTLRDVLQLHRRMPVELASYITANVIAGLGAAHAQGIVHRDVKPGNIMITRDGRVKVADFGIAKAVDMTQLTSTGNVVGTPAYMSPEQALAKDLDHRSDLFSAGVMLYEMLLGENPFQTGNPATTLSRVVHHQQRPAFETLPTTPVLLEGLLDSLLQKDADKRPSDSADACAQIAKAVAEDGAVADPAMMARYLRAPVEVSAELNHARARRHFERGMKVYDQGKGSAEAALWEFFLASLLDPASAEAKTWLEQVSSERGYTLQRKVTPKMEELEQRLAEDPDNLSLVLQLAKLHKAQGNFLQVIFYYKRARALRPADPYTKNQLTTLVGAQAAPVIDGTGMFLSPVDSGAAVKRARPQAVEPAMAEGWGDFFSGIFATTWAKVGTAAACLVAMILSVGFFIDHQAQAAERNASKRSRPASGDPAVDRLSEQIARAQSLTNRRKHDEAEAIYRSLLAEHEGDPYESEILYQLGDCLEHQGRRVEAMNIHGTNVQAHSDDWAARSHSQRADLFVVEHDLASARAEYEAMAGMSTGDRRIEALAAMADLTRKEGRLSAALGETEALLQQIPTDSAARDRVRLGLAELREETGDLAGAERMYAEIRDSTDHRSSTFKSANAGWVRMQAAAGSSVETDYQAAPSSWDNPPIQEGAGADSATVADSVDVAQDLIATATESTDQ